MATISLCMIVKNEEDTISRCLESVREAVDEIIVLDTGSTDNTVKIATEAGAKVYFFKWIDDFSAARNAAFQKATKQYIMWLDADDIILQEDFIKLKKLKDSLDGKVRQVVAKYNVGFDDSGNVNFWYYRERLFLRTAEFRWKGAVHETIAIDSGAVYADFAVTHKKIHPTQAGRNLRIFEKLLAMGETFSPRDKYYYARELYYNGFLEKSVEVLCDFLKSDAWQEDKIGACLMLSHCYKGLNKYNEAIDALTKSFAYTKPRAEICCELGNLFLERKNLRTAIFWYNCALSDNPNEESGAFIQQDSYNFTPLLQLSVCHDRLGEYQIAHAYNEEAGLIKPKNASVLYNRAYFKTKLAETAPSQKS